LSEEKGGFVEWDASHISNHIETSLKETTVNKKIGDNVASRYKHSLCEAPRTYFIMRKIRFLHRC
jgi:hypothetical protein